MGAQSRGAGAGQAELEGCAVPGISSGLKTLYPHVSLSQGQSAPCLRGVGRGLLGLNPSAQGPSHMGQEGWIRAHRGREGTSTQGAERKQWGRGPGCVAVGTWRVPTVYHLCAGLHGHAVYVGAPILAWEEVCVCTCWPGSVPPRAQGVAPPPRPKPGQVLVTAGPPQLSPSVQVLWGQDSGSGKHFWENRVSIKITSPHALEADAGFRPALPSFGRAFISLRNGVTLVAAPTGHGEVRLVMCLVQGMAL